MPTLARSGSSSGATADGLGFGLVFGSGLVAVVVVVVVYAVEGVVGRVCGGAVCVADEVHAARPSEAITTGASSRNQTGTGSASHATR